MTLSLDIPRIATDRADPGHGVMRGFGLCGVEERSTEELVGRVGLREAARATLRHAYAVEFFCAPSDIDRYPVATSGVA